jgi:hypothetical protein
MRKTTTAFALMILLSGGCVKSSDKDIQDIVRGHLFYTYRVDSLREPWPSSKIIVAAGTKLANMRFRFKPDMTAIRYEGKDPYFVGVGPVQRFSLVFDENTFGTYKFGSNEATVTGITDRLNIYQTDQHRIFYCSAVPDGDGMDGNE